ncbi:MULTISPECIES: hypothetical protein [Caproicibacterium]|uniref:YqzN/YkzM domain-containing protein n=1 Tax=Caproicibacterium argilliputei TaxID=3030016 RepID=A0AA97DCR3_9FIRM|nr:hypothetical protein [Caproicibacterium argilliputei]WOC33479.1 hypothetical protein PXC00_06325 [Caproicibacterium argilliputei]
MGDITYSIDEFVSAAKSLFGEQSGPDIVRAALRQAGKDRYTKAEASKLIKDFGNRPLSGPVTAQPAVKTVIPAKSAVSGQTSTSSTTSASVAGDKGAK